MLVECVVGIMALIAATVILKIADKRRYMFTCHIPLAYLYVTVNYAGYWMVKNVYLNLAATGYSMLNGILSIIMLVLGLIIMVTAIKKWITMWNSPRLQLETKVA
jgi:carbon starvation protein